MQKAYHNGLSIIFCLGEDDAVKDYIMWGLNNCAFTIKLCSCIVTIVKTDLFVSKRRLDFGHWWGYVEFIRVTP